MFATQYGLMENYSLLWILIKFLRGALHYMTLVAPNADFAISRHYSPFDVSVEAEANKAAGKYDNSLIDTQVDFYKKEGLTPYSEAKLPVTSDVPEGCVLIKPVVQRS
ncbi:hypothetical protein V6N11_042377 [Hibiscus sabdariffa]|uniref:TOD1/MUCI70 glycosyltransferase-like domain-containing protein n=1 Tax=Hibiscus sabdariffa TaxID=183260 RepID=A0ABR2QWV6_9ROSI